MGGFFVSDGKQGVGANRLLKTCFGLEPLPGREPNTNQHKDVLTALLRPVLSCCQWEHSKQHLPRGDNCIYFSNRLLSRCH